jgi:hypothetical protein
MGNIDAIYVIYKTTFVMTGVIVSCMLLRDSFSFIASLHSPVRHIAFV